MTSLVLYPSDYRKSALKHQQTFWFNCQPKVDHRAVSMQSTDRGLAERWYAFARINPAGRRVGLTGSLSCWDELVDARTSPLLMGSYWLTVRSSRWCI